MRLRAKMTLMLALPLTVGMAALTFSIGVASTRDARELTLRMLAEVGAARAAEIGRWAEVYIVAARRNAATDVMRSGDVGKILPFLVGRHADLEPEQDNEFFVSRDGTYYNSFGHTGNVSDREYVRKILSDGADYYVSDGIVSRDSGKYLTTFSVPVRGASGGIIGVSSTAVSLETLSKIAASVKIGGGYSFIVDGSLTVIAHTEPDYVMRLNLGLPGGGGPVGLGKAVREMREEAAGYRSFTDGAGGAKYLVFAKVPSTSWRIAVVVPVSRIDAGAVKITGMLIIISMTILAALVAMILFATERIARPIDSLSASVHRAMAGKFSPEALSVPVRVARRDEIGELANAFDEMRKNLLGSLEEQERALASLGESEERNRILVENAPDAIMVYESGRGCFIDCNRQAEILFGRGREELLHSRPIDLYFPDQPDGLPVEESVAASDARAKSGESFLVRRYIHGAGGKRLVCEVRVTPFPRNKRDLLRASYLDITDRVRAEEELEKSLREKDVLLQEVYHRTKNNMQVIASILDMESMMMGDAAAGTVMKEMVGRIQAMALVHEKLYNSQDLSRIGLKGYIEDLVANIWQAFTIDGQEVAIRLDVEEDIAVLIDTAIPCGLVINELVTNSIKYGFPGKRNGRISIAVARAGSGNLAITVADDGVGLPDGFDYRADGRMGFRMVVLLIESQLHGEVSLASGAGTGVRWTLTIPV